MITKYYGKVICSEDNPMVSLKDILEIIESYREDPKGKNSVTQEYIVIKNDLIYDLIKSIRGEEEDPEDTYCRKQKAEEEANMYANNDCERD